jgi:CRISPR/Cas system type I-B associated protein Csh2 (Cas7 group RAMP superfamily)
MNENVIKRVTGLLIIEVRNANPNGDRIKRVILAIAATTEGIDQCPIF